MKKILSIAIGALLLLPTMVFAAEFRVTVSCPETVEPGKEFKCTVSATEPSVTAFQANIDLTEAPNLQLNGTRPIESFIGRTGEINLKSTSNGTGEQKIKLTNIRDSNSNTAADVTALVSLGTPKANVKDNPQSSIDGALVLILVISALGIGGYYVFNKNSKFNSI